MARSTADSGTTGSSAVQEKRRRFGRRRPKDPSKPSKVKQVGQVFTMTRKQDPASVWWMALAFFGVLLAALLVGIWLDQVFYLLFVGMPLAILAAVVVLSRRAEKAAFSRIEGQPGATGAVLGSLRRGWFYDQEPVAAEVGGRARGLRDLNNAAMVFRAVGRPGVVLITEGPTAPALRLAQAERRKVNRVAGEAVPVHIVRIGTEEGDVRLSRLVKTMKSYDKKISKDEAIAVQRRLKALGMAKPPVPAGIDPRKARMDRRALRGR